MPCVSGKPTPFRRYPVASIFIERKKVMYNATRAAIRDASDGYSYISPQLPIGPLVAILDPVPNEPPISQ